jgi:Tol biopolymer transport system component
MKADIWAFGCVLFEMLAGRAAFSGRDVTDILAAVIRSEPEWKSLPANLHWRLRELLERCLEKEARDRYGSISDAKVEIQKVLADPSGVFAQPDITAKPRKRLRLGIPWVAAIAIFTLIVGGLLIWYLKPTEPRPVTRFYYELPEKQQFSNLSDPNLAVSPDGRQLVYGTSEGLYVRSMDQMEAKIITGPGENPAAPFFSPDGQWVGYIAGNQLKKIHINGGAPVTLKDPLVSMGYLDWAADGTIVFCQAGTAIMRVSANGGHPETIVRAENELLKSAQMLPDGKSVLFTQVGPQPGNKIIVQSLQTGERKELFAGDNARYIPTGHIVYAIDNDLFAVPFDLDKLEPVGGPVSAIEDVYVGLNPQYAVSNSGTLVYMPGTAGTTGSASTLLWVDRDGKEEPIAIPADLYSNPKISPDGGRVALTVGILQNADIKTWDLVRNNLTRLTFAPETDLVPLWSPNGERIAFLSAREGIGKIYWKAADGTGKAEPLGSGYRVGDYPFPSSWSADGKTLAVMKINLSELSHDIGVQPMEGEQKYEPLLKESYNESEPKISPDGQWIAYTSDESDRYEVFVRPFPDVESGGRWQVSTDGGYSPLWAPDGRELFYLNGDAVMAVSVKTEPTFSPETPRMLFQGAYDSTAQHLNPLYLNSWDISPDGKRFLMIKPVAATGDESTSGGPRKINIVLNWFEELKDRVPVK